MDVKTSEMNQNVQTLEKRKIIIGIIITIIGGIFWGVSGTCGQFLFQNKNVTSEWLVPIRLISAGSIAVIISLLRDKKKAFSVWKDKKDVRDLIIFGLLGIMMCQFLYFVTIQLSNAGTATVIQYINPVLIMVVMCVIEKTLPTKIDVIAIVLVLVGIFLLATHGNIHTLVLSRKALISGFLSAVAVVIYNVQPQRIMKKYSTFTLLGWAMIIGGIVLTILCKPWKYHPIMDVQTILAMLVIIIFGTIVSFTIYMLGTKIIGPTKASMIASVEPVAATALSAVWLKVSFTGLDFVGFILIILTIFILALQKKA